MLHDGWGLLVCVGCPSGGSLKERRPDLGGWGPIFAYNGGGWGYGAMSFAHGGGEGWGHGRTTSITVNDGTGFREGLKTGSGWKPHSEYYPLNVIWVEDST